MSGLHPQYMLSKRFPVHAAIELQDLHTFASLLCNKREASYHFDRKLTNSEVSISLAHKLIILQIGKSSSHPSLVLSLKK